jgi:hypothetical protein
MEITKLELLTGIGSGRKRRDRLGAPTRHELRHAVIYIKALANTQTNPAGRHKVKVHQRVFAWPMTNCTTEEPDFKIVRDLETNIGPRGYAAYRAS